MITIKVVIAGLIGIMPMAHENGVKLFMPDGFRISYPDHTSPHVTVVVLLEGTCAGDCFHLAKRNVEIDNNLGLMAWIPWEEQLQLVARTKKPDAMKNGATPSSAIPAELDLSSADDFRWIPNLEHLTGTEQTFAWVNPDCEKGAKSCRLLNRIELPRGELKACDLISDNRGAVLFSFRGSAVQQPVAERALFEAQLENGETSIELTARDLDGGPLRGMVTLRPSVRNVVTLLVNHIPTGHADGDTHSALLGALSMKSMHLDFFPMSSKTAGRIPLTNGLSCQDIVVDPQARSWTPNSLASLLPKQVQSGMALPGVDTAIKKILEAVFLASGNRPECAPRTF